MAMIHMEPQTLQLFERVLETLKPPPNLTLSQWADKYRRLSAEASSAKGQWNTDNAPFQREIMDAIGDVHIRKVVAMMCAQAGKTEGLILNTVGFYMSYYPAPIMIVQPTVNLGESFSKDRLATIFNDTTTAYVGAGYHGTTQRVAVPIAGTLRPRELLSTTYAKAGVWGTRQQESAKIIGILLPKDHKAATYAPVGCAAIRMQMTAYIKGNIRPADHKATTLAPAGIAAYRQQIEVRIGGMNT